jgi:TolB-like protein
MASIIEGYTYDIFISYRQNDNKYDGWVTEFVDNLNKELEANIKDKISVYFDINPHDGLLETHSVDQSLEDKLKCLIFIPIISRTYCDPKSFAWQHEFCVFNKLAKEDQFGRDIRLASGNVASRILPVKIHDLDPEDKELVENELGEVLRGIEFIYKEAGVNRPLRANEDHPQDNLNKTYYRDQINKVANAVKEIISALKKHNLNTKETSKPELEGKHSNNRKIKIIAGTLIILALIILGYFIVPTLLKTSETGDKSIAVLPFTNLSNDPEQEFFSDGIVEAILNYLYKVGDLRVVSNTTSKRYKDTELSIKEISKELGVSSILEGSVQKVANNVRITAQLIDANTDNHLWSGIYDRNISDIFIIQSEVAQNVARELKAKLTTAEREQIENSPTKNPEAYSLYLQGRFYWNKRTKDGLQKSVEYFEKAIAADPQYALAYAGLADAYFIQACWSWIPWAEGVAKSKELALQALDIDNNLSEAHTVLGALLNYRECNCEGARKELQLAIELNPNFVTAHHYYSELLDILRENNEAREQINIALRIDPYLPVLHALSARYFYNSGSLKESLEECFILHELNPEYSKNLYWREFHIYRRQKEDMKAIEALQKALNMDTLKVTDPDIVTDVYNKSGISGILNWLIMRQLNSRNPNALSLANFYAILGQKEEALNWLEKACENPIRRPEGINNNPHFDILRSESRFKAIIKKLGLSEYQTPK